MGLDLELKVLRFGYGTGTTTDLFLDRQYAFFQLFDDTGRVFDVRPICKVNQLGPSEAIYKHTDTGEERTTQDPYGNSLTYVFAQDVKKIPGEVREKLTEWNRAALAYIQELPDDTKIYLWWC